MTSNDKAKMITLEMMMMMMMMKMAMLNKFSLKLPINVLTSKFCTRYY